MLHLNRVGSSTMTGSHIAVALGDGSADGQVTVLAVHVVGSRPLMDNTLLIHDLNSKAKKLSCLVGSHISV
jgi:hypothetical protein